MLTKSLKPGQIFTANKHIYKVTKFEKSRRCATCRETNAPHFCAAQEDGFICAQVCGWGYYPKLLTVKDIKECQKEQ